MLALVGNTDLLRLITSAAGDIDCHVSFSVVDTSITEPGDRVAISNQKQPGITTATTTTICAAPSTTTKQHNVKTVIIFNVHGSVANTITIEVYDGTNPCQLFKATLEPGESIVWKEGEVWRVLDVNGYVKTTAIVPNASDTVAGISMIASQADQEGGTDVNKQVVPGRQHFHPGHPKFWLKCGVTANVLASYNVTSLTDTGAGRVTITIGTDFSSAEWCCLATVQRSSATMALSDMKVCNIRTASQAAGTVEIECMDASSTPVQEDPTSYHVVGHGDHA